MTSFFIVVPTFNSAEFLGRCLAGLLEMQPGGFELHVRVQDGGSSDATCAIAEAWARRVAAGEVPDAEKRRLSIVSARDRGLYDAVATAFDSVAGDGYEVLTWVGSDDWLMPGALATVAKVFQRFPQIRWMTGQPQVVDREGACYSPWPLAFARRDLRRGLHDGRGLPFVQQEGTFWRSTLYREAGGLRHDLRLAGDFDLWRRFARTDDLVTCSFPLGIWRHRAGQASGDLAAYYGEVERVLAETGGVPPLEEDLARHEHVSRYRPVVLERNFGDDYVLREEGLPFQPLEGFSPMLRPEPEYGLHTSHVRIVARTARTRIPILECGVPYRVAIRFRNSHRGQRLTIRMGDAILHDAPVPCHDAGAPQVVAFRFVPDVRHPVVTVKCRAGGKVGRWRRLVARLRARPVDPWKASTVLIEDVAFCRDAPPREARRADADLARTG